MAAPAVGQKEGRAPLNVTYIANDGFMIESQAKKVVIDAMFGGWKSEYYFSPSDSILRSMEMALPPFDNIDVIAVTHNHMDHCKPAIIASHMKHNPRAILVCPPQVAEDLAALEGYTDIKNRIKIITAPIDSLVSVDINGINITAILGKHGSYFETDTLTGETIDRHRDIQHMEYLISIGGRKAYHSGDAPLNDMTRYERLGFGRDTVDLAMIQWFTPGEMVSFREKLVKQVIGAKKIMLMHLVPGSKIFEPEYKKICEDRNLILPQKSMERWVIE